MTVDFDKLIRIVTHQAYSYFNLACHHLVTFAIFSDIIFDITYTAPFIICYWEPHLLLSLHWQEFYATMMTIWEHVKYGIFSALYLMIDFIGYLYYIRGIFKE